MTLHRLSIFPLHRDFPRLPDEPVCSGMTHVDFDGQVFVAVVQIDARSEPGTGRLVITSPGLHGELRSIEEVVERRWLVPCEAGHGAGC